MCRTATSEMLPALLSDPSMLYKGMGYFNFWVRTLFSRTKRRFMNLVVAPLSTIAVISFCLFLPRSKTGM